MAKIPEITVKLTLEDETLDELAQLIADKVAAKLAPTPEPTKDQEPDEGYAKTAKATPATPAKPAKPEPKDDVSAWEIDYTEKVLASIENGDYDDDGDGEEMTLYDLTNRELRSIIKEKGLGSMLKSNMRKDDMVPLAEVAYAIDYNHFDDLNKDALLLAAEALGVRDQVTTKTRKDDLLFVVKEANEPR